MTLGYVIHFLCFIYVTNGESNGKYTLPDHLANVKPPVISVRSGPESLFVNIQGDRELWRELASHAGCRVLYKEENDKLFKPYEVDFSCNRTRVTVGPLHPKVKYCVKVIYIGYDKEIADVNASSLECAVVTESEETTVVRTVVVTIVTVGVLCTLLPYCTWELFKRRQQLKQALRQPIDLPADLYEFFTEDRHHLTEDIGLQPFRSSMEETCDTLSVVTVTGPEDEEDDRDPRMLLVLAGVTSSQSLDTRLPPGGTQRPDPTDRDPSQADKAS